MNQIKNIVFIYLIFCFPTAYAENTDITNSTILVYRNEHMGSKWPYSIKLNGRSIARLPKNSLLYIHVPAGHYEISTDHFNSDSKLEVDVSNGDKKYIWAEGKFFGKNVMLGGVDLKAVDITKAETDIQQLTDHVVVSYFDEYPMLMPDGSKYDGETKDGLPHGFGRLLNSYNMSIFEGDWLKGKPTGYGILYYANGDVFWGEFANGKPNGNGSFLSDKLFFEGAFYDNMPHGKCLFVYSSGDKFEGEFKNGKVDGHVTYHINDGRKIEAEYSKGILIKKDLYNQDGSLIKSDQSNYSQPNEMAPNQKSGFSNLVSFLKDVAVFGIIVAGEASKKHNTNTYHGSNNSLINSESIFEQSSTGKASDSSASNQSHDDLSKTQALKIKENKTLTSNASRSYESIFGRKYQYDLSKPIDRLRYSIDPSAKIRDDIDVSPYKNIEQDMGQFGGGVLK